MVFMVLGLGTFLLGGVAFAVDIANLWFHRQTAQNAADAACTAGAADLLAGSLGGATGSEGFTAGTAFNCAAATTAAPCIYAAYNGYDGQGTSPGNSVTVGFPSSDPNVANTTPPLPPAAMVPFPFMRVDILDHVQTFFSGLLSGAQTQDVRAFAVCGVLLLYAPTPMVVLDPKTTSLTLQGNSSTIIYGGPSRSLQVNSNAATAISVKGGASLDLSKGGPNLTGSSLGVLGGPTTAPGGFSLGTTGSWQSPSSLVSDPFAELCAPGQSGCPKVNGSSAPAIPGAPTIPSDQAALGCKSIPCSLNYHDPVHGCPDSGGCLLYTAGYYGSKISISNHTAVFDPGIYYLANGLTLGSNSAARPGTGAGDGSGGTVFYLSGSSSLSLNANSGKRTLDPFYASSLKCTGGSQLPANLPAATALQGNILVAPCTGYYGDPLGTSDPSGEQRGMLFFQDRSASNVNADWSGGGQFLLAGSMYFHHCNASGTGVGCGAPTTYYDATLSLGGNSGSTTYVLGNIIVDNLSLAGTAGITMDLSHNAAYWVLKAALIR